VGFLCAQYTVKSVLLVFALTFVLIAAWIWCWCSFWGIYLHGTFWNILNAHPK
jgi:hypothetical protein